MVDDNQVRATAPPYWELLHLAPPWMLKTMHFDYPGRRIEMEIFWHDDASEGTRCPKCDGAVEWEVSPGVERRWLSLSVQSITIVLRATLPTVRCSTHGALETPVPWECDGSWGTVPARPLLKRIHHRVRKLLVEASARKTIQEPYVWLTRRIRPIADRLAQPWLLNNLTRIPDRPSRSLPIDPNPPYKTYHCFAAHPLSIVGGATDLSPLLASHFINLACSDTLYFEDGFGFGGTMIVPRLPIGWFIARGYCELHSESELPPSFLKEAQSIVEWMQQRLQEGWYLLTHLNKYYIDEFWAKSTDRKDCLHDCLITGWNSRQRTFQLLMYLASGKYDLAHVSYENMVRSLTLRGRELFAGIALCHAHVMLAVRPRRSLKFEFEITHANTNLHRYLHSRPPDSVFIARNHPIYAGDWTLLCGYPTESHQYGVNAFARIVQHMKVLINQKNRIDARDSRALMEHKQILRRNLKYWSQQVPSPSMQGLYDRYAPVVAWTYSLHGKCMLYNEEGTSAAAALESHLESAEAIVDLERTVLSRALLSLRSASQT